MLPSHAVGIPPLEGPLELFRLLIAEGSVASFCTELSLGISPTLISGEGEKPLRDPVWSGTR